MVNEGGDQYDRGSHRSPEMGLKIDQPALVVPATAFPLRNAGTIYLRIQALLCSPIGDTRKLESVAYRNPMPVLGRLAAALAKRNRDVV